MPISSTPFQLFIKNYWQYYRELEDELLSTQRYVYFCEDNFNTYSIEYLKLYQAICSEIDVIGKAMAAQINPQFKPENTSNNIYKWWFEIQNNYTLSNSYCKSDNNYFRLNCYTEDFLNMISITPWDNFEVEKYADTKGHIRLRSINNTVPKWWSDYNKVKHNRTSIITDNPSKINYCKANLKNVCYALTALHTLEKAYMQKLGTKTELERFADYSKCFDIVQNSSTEDIDRLFVTL